MGTMFCLQGSLRLCVPPPSPNVPRGNSSTIVLVPVYQPTWHHITQERNHQYHRENSKCHKEETCWKLKDQQDRTNEMSLQRTTLMTSKEGKIVCFLIPITGQLSLNHDENCQRVCHQYNPYKK